MTGYCEPDDVRKVLQDTALQGETASEFVTPAIAAQNQWLRKATGRHWYDSGHGGTDLFTSARTVSDLSLDVPSSPHSSDRQLFRDDHGIRYPVTHVGQYSKIRLPYRDVQSIDKLEVRQRGGGVEDWVAASNRTQGRGDDYYTLAEGETGVTHLYVDAESIATLSDYTDLLTVELTYGEDGIDDTIRQAVAMRAAAYLVVDDEAQIGIPDNGQFVSVQTKAQELRENADMLIQGYRRQAIA